MTGPLRSLPPQKTLGVWQMALLLGAVLFALLLLNNRQYLFATKLYENADWAAISLAVRHAMHSPLLYGHYSQWHLFHPGPAVVDTLMAGELLFYDALHVVPTPYNGQLIATALVATLAFSLALSIYAHRLGSGGGGYLFFLPIALALAFWHYGTVGVQVSLNALPTFTPIFAFLCFVVSAAAVGSGSGRELPALAVAGGWLVHNHAAQPLFVGPLALLAYAGLLFACCRPSVQTQAEGGTGADGLPWLGAPSHERTGSRQLWWRSFSCP